MARIMAFDYGIKRTGVAVTDPLKMIASPLETVETPKLTEFLSTYLKTEEVETFVVGLPRDLSDNETHGTQPAQKFINKLKSLYPTIKLVEADERYTSKMAMETMIAGGMKKKDRRNKANLDKISAAIILQSYLEENPSL